MYSIICIGNVLPTGERGEIVVRGSLVMAGYYKNPSATEEASHSDGIIQSISATWTTTITCLSSTCNGYLAHPFTRTARAVGVADGNWVVLETAMGRVRLKAKCNDALHPRVVATQYGWWQGCRELGLPGYDPFGPDGANVNLLIPNAAIDPISASVPHRSQMCRVRKEG
jgi:hypothetical protein